MSESDSLYCHEELYTGSDQRFFAGAGLSEIAFPLGGIGTGTITLGGRGNLRDFEFQNHADKGHVVPFTFFALWAREADKAPVALVLEGQIPPPYRAPAGEPSNQLSGLPRFRNAAFKGEYPMATVELSDTCMPLDVTLRAWNPFIPLNVPDSGLPTAIFEWTFTNNTSSPIDISLAASTSNCLCARDASGQLTEAGSTNDALHSGAVKGLHFSHPQADPTDASTGTFAIATSWEETDVIRQWYRGGWFDKSHFFWDSFAATGSVVSEKYTEEATSGDIGSLILHAVVPASGSVTLPVTMTWHFPLMENPWTDVVGAAPLETYVAKRFRDAWDVAQYVHAEIDRLRENTERWRDSVFGSTLPGYVLEAITSQVSTMRTNTCFLLSDGSFYGWEGTWANRGSCHGSCTHVWNYEQAVAFLFPELERSMRRTEFLGNTRLSGNMAYRTVIPPGQDLWNYKPCVDGQMGAIIQAYRDWQLSGDDDFLREIWPSVSRALEYAWTMTPDKMEGGGRGPVRLKSAEKHSIDSLWDPDKDGVMEGEQHNTYDIEFFGPNTMGTAMYLGALKACERIALYLGDDDKAAEYRSIYESGRAKVDDELWNGEYYVQKIVVIPEVTVPDVLRSPSDSSTPKYQYGEGCLSDQLVGQWCAHVAGLGYILDDRHVRSAVRSIFRHNFRHEVGSHANVQRVYALNDEPGLLLCSWPNGARPTLPFIYSDEVWTGIEYQVASHLIYEGWIDEGLTLVKAVSERYAGFNRNPWNQIECGFHYARAMSSWSVKLALDGFEYSAPEKRLGFAPKINADNYQTFWSIGTAWGVYSQNLPTQTFTLEVKYGALTIQSLDLTDLTESEVSVLAPYGQVAVKLIGKRLLINTPITLEPGEKVVISKIQHAV